MTLVSRNLYGKVWWIVCRFNADITYGRKQTEEKNQRTWWLHTIRRQ